MATIVTRETGATAVNRTLTNAELDNNFINLNSDIQTKQPLDGDLTAIAALTGSGGLLKRAGDNSWLLDYSTYATQTYVGIQIANLVASAPTTLDTLNELASALGNDANFSTTITTALGNKQPLDADLTAIAALSGTSGFLKKTAADTWALDTNSYALSSHTHAYLSAESDTLATVTGRGASTSTAVTLSSTANHYSGHFYWDAYEAGGNHYPHFNDGASASGAKVNWRLYTGGTNSVTHYWDTSTALFNTKLESSVRVDAPIFYDRDDTAYYVNPNNTSRLYELKVGGGPGGNTAGNLYIQGNYDWRWIAGYSPDYGIGNGFGLYSDTLGYYLMSVSTSGNWYFGQNNHNSSYRLSINGTGYATSDFRAPIFYDSDDTTYYGDFASTSRFNKVGIGGSALNSSTVLSVAGTSHFPDEIFTGGTAGSLNSWGARWWTTGGQMYWGSNGANFTNYGYGTQITTLSIPTSGSVSAYADFRAPVFYDSNNTGYYLDPNGSTSLRTVGDWRSDSSTWTGEYSGKIQYHSNNWYFQAADQFIWRNSSGTNVVYGDQAGNHWAVASSRSPIFYDNNDTGYYIDPNSTGAAALRMRGGALFGPNPTWGRYLYIGGNGDYDSAEAQIFTTNGNLHLEAKSGNSIYLASYRGSWFYANGWYDYNDSAYYVDPNSTSRMYQINFNNLYYAPDTNYGFIGTSIYVDTINSGYSTDQLEINYVRGTWAGISHDSLRAPIFYDYDDTNYYVNPNSTSRMNRIDPDEIYNYGWFRNHNNLYGLYNQANGTHFYSNGAASWAITGSGGTVELQFRSNHQTTVRGYIYGNTSSDFGFLDSSGNWRVRTNSGYQELYATTYTDTQYGYIWYDRNDSAYYLDPNSTSRISTVAIIGNTYLQNSSPTIYFQDSDHRSAMIHVNSNLFHVLRGSGTGSTSWEQYDGYWPLILNLENNSAQFGGQITKRGVNVPALWVQDSAPSPYNYNDMWWESDTGKLKIYYYDGNTAQWVDAVPIPDTSTFFSKAGGGITGPVVMSSSLTTEGLLTATGAIALTNQNLKLTQGDGTALRVTTAYGYMNLGPQNASWCHMYSDKSFYFNQNLYMNGNWLLYENTWQNGKYFSSDGIVYGNASIRGPIFYDYNDTGFYIDPNSYSYVSSLRAGSYLASSGNIYTDSNYGYGHVGVYTSTRYQGVFAMGDSYKLPADGTTTGSLYGIAWSHPNAGGTAANLNTHGALILENGGFLAALSGSIRCRDDMRAPIFYDSGNTAYYVDPNATGTSINVAGTITAAGNVTAYSDIRVKRDVKPITNAIAKVKQLNGVTFQRTDVEDARQTGIIAQDVLKVLPEAVRGSEKEFYSVAYGNMVGLLVEAIKEQQSEIDELKALVKQLLAN